MRPVAVPPSRWVLFWAIALGGAAFDLATKAWIFARVPLGSHWPLVPRAASGPLPAFPHDPRWDGTILELRTSYNKGALWGLGTSLPNGSLIFAALSVVAGAAILVWLFGRGAAADARLTAALALIMAGALGNCYDRLAFGHVRDFAHVQVRSIGFDFAIFNFADNMLVLGAGALILMALKPEPPAEGSSGGVGPQMTQMVADQEKVGEVR